MWISNSLEIINRQTTEGDMIHDNSCIDLLKIRIPLIQWLFVYTKITQKLHRVQYTRYLTKVYTIE